jgi:hypothetical protein
MFGLTASERCTSFDIKLGCVWSSQDLARQESSKSCAKLKQAAPVHPCTRGIPFILNISPGKLIPIAAPPSVQIKNKKPLELKKWLALTVKP